MAGIFQGPITTADQKNQNGFNQAVTKKDLVAKTDDAGNTVYEFEGKLYDSQGREIGTAAGSTTAGTTAGTTAAGTTAGTTTAGTTTAGTTAGTTAEDEAAAIDREFGVPAPQYKTFSEKEPDQYTANMEMMKQYLPTPISEEEQKKRARIGSAMQGLEAFSNGLSALAGLYSAGNGGYALQIPQADTQSVHKWLTEQDAKRTQNAQLLAQAAGRDEAAYQQARAAWLARKQAIDEYNNAEKANYENRHLSAVIAKHKEDQDAAAAKQKAEEAAAQRKSSEKIAAGHDATSERNNRRSNQTQITTTKMREKDSHKDSEEELNSKYQGHRKADPTSWNDWAKANNIRIDRSGPKAEQKRDYNAWCEKNGRGTYKRKPAANKKPAAGKKPAGKTIPGF